MMRRLLLLGMSLSVCTLWGQFAANPEPLYQKGVEALNRGSAYEALAYLEKAADANPGFRDVQLLLGRGYMMTGQVRLAKRRFEKALEANPLDSQAAMFLGLSLYQASRHHEAVEALTRAEHLAPQNPFPFIYRGLAHLKLGHAKAARDDIEVALARAPGDVTARGALAELELGEGRYQAAESSARSVLERDPNNVEIRVLLGKILFESGQPGPAAQEYARVLAVVPDRTEVRYLLALAQLRSGDRKAGRESMALFKVQNAREDRLKLLDTQTRAEPDNTAARFEIVKLLIEHGRPQKAIPFLQDLKRLLPNDSRVDALARKIR